MITSIYIFIIIFAFVFLIIGLFSFSQDINQENNQKDIIKRYAFNIFLFISMFFFIAGQYNSSYITKEHCFNQINSATNESYNNSISCETKITQEKGMHYLCFGMILLDIILIVIFNIYAMKHFGE